MSQIRAFVAVDLPLSLKKEIIKFETSNRKNFLGEKWVDPENLHITVLFLGYLEPEKLNQLSKGLKEATKEFLAFEIETEKFDYNLGYPKRMVWVYFKKSNALMILNATIKNILDKLEIDYKKESRDFLPHITLTRLKNIKTLKLIKRNIKSRFLVQEIKLKQSILKKSGAVYRDINTFNLTKD